MTKFLVIPRTKEQIATLQNQMDGIVLGVKDYSVNYETTFSLPEIETITKQYQGDIFLSINKNILNHELKGLEDLLQYCTHLPIKGILFYDLALLRMYQKESFPYDLIWAQEHFTTNYATIQYYEKEGVKGTLLSSDITLQEILTIREKTNMYLITPIFGYLPMFVSRRHLIDNYKKTFSLTEEDKAYYITKGTERYPIVEDKNGTFIYSSQILNGAVEYPTLEKKQMDYVLLNSFRIPDTVFAEILSLFRTITDTNKEEIQKQIHQLCHENTNTGFFEKETIFKVKKV